MCQLNKGKPANACQGDAGPRELGSGDLLPAWHQQRRKEWDQQGHHDQHVVHRPALGGLADRKYREEGNGQAC
ncbi:MAG: hypothetical protein PF961_09070 [Planctomycetota bacterium]|nr:hypothetical protein [Planctomycetota bacterium]